MKPSQIFLLCLLLFACTTPKKNKDAIALLNESIKVHDKNNNWRDAKLTIHIQEPRVSNPHRYSILKLDNMNGTFELSRNKETHLAKYIIDEKGKSSVLLDDGENIDSIFIKKYKLYPNRNSNYKKFYTMLYGLPMSIPQYSETVSGGEEIIFNKEQCYKIQLKLKEPVITKFWNVYISQKDNYVVGIEIFHEDDNQ
ncbi:MAG: DUF6503 family protein [Cyclobacteriaceae bacterium]